MPGRRREPGFTTRALGSPPSRDPQSPEPVRETPLSEPIYQAATFAFDDIERFAAVGKSKISGGYLYSRWANPTVDALGRLVASLEGAEATACFGSGMGAIHGVFSALVASGDHIVAARQIYGGAFGLLAHQLPRAGVAVDFVDVTDPGAFAAAIRPATKVLYCETIGNPTLPVADLDALAPLAHEAGVVLVVDATFTPPYLLRPLDHGVDIAIHSATKYLAGHADLMAGVASGSAEIIGRVRMANLDTGAVLAPIEAWLTARGIQTLALRMDRICANAQSLAAFFRSHAGVDRVHYPGLPDHPQHDLASGLLPRGFGGMLAFEVEGGLSAGRRVLERLRVVRAAASLGSTHTLAVHPASVTHTQLSRDERERIGIADGLLRVSVGIEDADDLLDDFDHALS